MGMGNLFYLALGPPSSSEAGRPLPGACINSDLSPLLIQGAPWSVRLSTKLLRDVALGPQSPRWPYLQVMRHRGRGAWGVRVGPLHLSPRLPSR